MINSSAMKALSPYQQAVLTELGIVQWRLRAPDLLALQPDTPSAGDLVPEQTEAVVSELKSEPLVEPVLKADNQHPLFKDILLAVEALESGKAFEWQIADTFSIEGGLLKAPSPQTLSLQPELKKQLWQVLQQHL